MEFEKYKEQCFAAYCTEFPGEYDSVCPLQCEEFYNADRQTIAFGFAESMTPKQVCAELWS